MKSWCSPSLSPPPLAHELPRHLGKGVSSAVGGQTAYPEASMTSEKRRLHRVVPLNRQLSLVSCPSAVHMFPKSCQMLYKFWVVSAVSVPILQVKHPVRKTAISERRSPTARLSVAPCVVRYPAGGSAARMSKQANEQIN